MSVFTSEFLGTGILVLLGNSLVACATLGRTRGQGVGWLAVAIGWGLALCVGVWIAAASGAHLNPAVTLALALFGYVQPAALGTHIPAQLCGAAVGALCASAVFLPHWRATQNPEHVLACHCTVPAIRAPISNLFAQAVGMFVLVFAIHAIVTHPWTPPVALTEDQVGTLVPSEAWRGEWWQFAGGLGLLLAAVMLSIGGATGGAMNPARDLSSRLVHFVLPLPGKGSSDWSYAWVAVLGPIFGAIAGVAAARATGLR